jgi:hypothetical protein
MNRKIPDQELLDSLKSAANDLGQDYITIRQYINANYYSSTIISKRFGSFGHALELAGLKNRSRNPILHTEESVIIELKRVAKILGKTSFSQKEFVVFANVSVPTIKKIFGSFNAALIQAGLNPNEPATKDDIASDMIGVSKIYGKNRITEREYLKKSNYSIWTIIDRFGSINEAFKYAGLEICIQKNN